jgi:two-component system chemotaxis response regulator CheB
MDENNRIEVLVVDDSALMRSLISKMINSQNDMVVKGTAMNGIFALNKLPSLDPDIIILDIEMPEMNGIEFLKERKKRNIEIPVVVLSSVAEKGARVTFDAIALGASDFITKPSGSATNNINDLATNLCSLIRAYARQDKKTITPKKIEKFTYTQPYTAPVQMRKEQAPLLPHAAKGAIDIVAIGISTGGPNALRVVLADLKPDFKVPIVIVQHMPEGFTLEFAKSLSKICPLDVKEAENMDIVKPGRILIAPGNKHMRIEKRKLGTVAIINSDEPVNGHRPSAGVLFESVAESYGSRAMAIIMTGMGHDGAAEIGKIYKAGGFTIAQDEKTSVVFGMPRVAIEYGFAHKILPLEEIAKFITDYTS